MRLGIDTGGTFTDLVDDDGRVVKVPSTPDDPARAVRAAVAAVTGSDTGPDAGLDAALDELRPALLAHGTTVATNALLERRLGRVALVTNAGFADLIEIARQARPALYDLHADRPPPLVPREWRHEVTGRLDAHGNELLAFDGVLPTLDDAVETVAVCLLHSDLDPVHERAVAAAFAARGIDAVCSVDVSPEFREYERMVTTVADAALRPVCRAYLDVLRDVAEEVLVMTSAGGLVPVADAAAHPAHLLLSGPAGGVQAAATVAAACGFPDAVAFDMGGTSTDVCLVLGGAPAPAATHTVAGFPIRLPALAVHTIGAGGGSIAAVDPGGALTVGPRSAGAQPGPACYGHGGAEPTVTDADLVLGRIPADHPLPGLGNLDVAAAHAALARAGVTAAGVVAVVDAAMERAVRAVTVEQGVDPRELALVAFGGAGPLHACAVADALGMRTVIVPARAGVFSAVGLVGSPRRRELVQSWNDAGDPAGALVELAARARTAVGDTADTVVETFVDCRYRGQSHEITVPTIAGFPAAHARHNGYTRDGVPVEVIALRARAERPAPLLLAELPAPAREVATGPAVVAEADCTLWVPEGWTARPGPTGAWLVTRRMSLDAASLQILVSRLAAIADEMGTVLRRAASSPNIKERADCSAALFTARGELLAQAEHIPVHLGSMPASVLAAIAAAGDDPAAFGDVILNDPFAGGTHLNDITVVSPVFVDGALVGWVANRAHHADVGGIAPGSMPPDALTVDEEGLRLPPVRFDADAEARIVEASRTGDERRGDLAAQRGANRLGARRLATLIESLGPADALTMLDEVLDYGERRMRAALHGLPDGEWRADDVLDSAGPRPEQQSPTPVVVTLRVHGDEVTFDFTGTGAQRPGTVNAVEAVTVSAVGFALRCATDPTIPANGGAMRPVRVVAPAGTVVAATPPVAVGAGNVEVSQRVADVCLAALEAAAPGHVGGANQGTMNNVLLGGLGGLGGDGGEGGRAWVYYETIGGGQGARPWADGMSGVHTVMTNTRDTPVEALERELPLRVVRYTLRRGSGGEGHHRGGDGIERDLEVLTDTTVSLVTERRWSRPAGSGPGAGPGAPGENWLLPGGNEAAARRLPDKCTVELRAGDVLRVRTPGGGGWSAASPAER